MTPDDYGEAVSMIPVLEWLTPTRYRRTSVVSTGNSASLRGLASRSGFSWLRKKLVGSGAPVPTSAIGALPPPRRLDLLAQSAVLFGSIRATSVAPTVPTARKLAPPLSWV